LAGDIPTKALGEAGLEDVREETMARPLEMASAMEFFAVRP
jgi:hypothetical protein